MEQNAELVDASGLGATASCKTPGANARSRCQRPPQTSEALKAKQSTARTWPPLGLNQAAPPTRAHTSRPLEHAPLADRLIARDLRLQLNLHYTSTPPCPEQPAARAGLRLRRAPRQLRTPVSSCTSGFKQRCNCIPTRELTKSLLCQTSAPCASRRATSTPTCASSSTRSAITRCASRASTASTLMAPRPAGSSAAARLYARIASGRRRLRTSRSRGRWISGVG